MMTKAPYFFKSLASKRTIAFLHDVIVIFVAWYGAYWLRFNLETIPNNELLEAHHAFEYVLCAHALSFWYMGLYRGIWRFASMPDLIRIFKAILLGGLLSMMIIFFMIRLEGIPRSIFPINGMLLILLLGGSRFTIRWLKDYGLSIRQKHPGKRALIIGAGQAGEWLIRDLIRQEQKIYNPILLIDDQTNRLGREIHGVRVLGTTQNLIKLVEKYHIEQLIIAIPSANTAQMQRIVTLCEKTHLPIQTVPKLDDLVSGKHHIQDLRQISIEDLLGRDPVQLNWNSIQASLNKKSILITGAGGSIGSELCRQIANLSPQTLILIDHCEYNLFAIEQDLKNTHPKLSLQLHLVSVCDPCALKHIFSKHQPEIVFHAAAYKHVPLLENQLREAILNNVIGTHFVIQAAIEHQVQDFVLVSSDKAVNPSNVMGLSKRLTEILCEHYNHKHPCHFITVRFGNVLDSAGSVVPIFKAQIQAGGPVTVTDPNIKRFFMTIPEATQLILQALTLGTGGEIFVLDMGEPIKIKDLAEHMITLSGKTLDEIQIEYTDLRPGEKMYEELFYSSECLEKTVHRKIQKAISQQPEIPFNALIEALEELQSACRTYNLKKITAIAESLALHFEPNLVEYEN